MLHRVESIYIESVESHRVTSSHIESHGVTMSYIESVESHQVMSSHNKLCNIFFHDEDIKNSSHILNTKWQQ